MAYVGFTANALIPGAMRGYPNEGPWDTRLTDLTTSAQELPGIFRAEGPNTYMYVQFGTGAINSAGLPVKITTSLTDNSGIIPAICVTALGATAAGYFSALGVTVTTGTGVSGARYGWILVQGIATLPLNSNTAGLALNIPIAPSSASAGFAECAAGSSVGRSLAPGGATLGTATQTAAGGILCYINFLRSFV